MSEATQRGKSEGNCRTSQGSKFFFPTFPYLLLVVCSKAVLACFRGYGLWAHAWYLCHFHGSKKKSLLFSILGGKKIKEEFPICKLTYAHMSLLQQHTLRSRIFVKKNSLALAFFPTEAPDVGKSNSDVRYIRAMFLLFDSVQTSCLPLSNCSHFLVKESQMAFKTFCK